MTRLVEKPQTLISERGSVYSGGEASGFLASRVYNGASFPKEEAMAIVKEKLFVEQTKVTCSGDKDDPHPTVFLTMGTKGFVSCPYCGKLYIFNMMAVCHAK